MLMMSPVIQALKEAHPRDSIELITSSAYMNGALVAIAKRNPYIDVIHDVDPREHTTPDTNKYQKLEGADIAQLALVQTAQRVIDLNTVCMQHEHSTNQPVHRTLVWAAEAQVCMDNVKPVYTITKAERKWARELFARITDRPRIGISLTAAHLSRVVNAHTIRDIIMACRDAGYEPITVDSTYHTDLCQGIAGASINEAFAAIAEMQAVVCNDSGVLHMAGTVGTPIVGLFGSVPAYARMAFYDGIAISSPLSCAPCWYGHPCLNHSDKTKHYACMSSFDVSAVIQAVRTCVEKRIGTV